MMTVALSVTWRNIFILVGLSVSVLSAMGAGTSLLVQWRFDGLQIQLNERMNLYAREISLIESRLDRLENRNTP